MRTIKFRGYNKKRGIWLYGNYILNRGAHFIAPQEFADGKTWEDYEVEEESIGQFTGLTDKNGKEIYEGDIVRHPWKDPIFGDLVETGQFVHSTICFNNGAFVVNYRLQGEYIYLQDFVRLKCLEVVGNINDNPELIEKGDKK